MAQSLSFAPTAMTAREGYVVAGGQNSWVGSVTNLLLHLMHLHVPCTHNFLRQIALASQRPGYLHSAEPCQALACHECHVGCMRAGAVAVLFEAL